MYITIVQDKMWYMISPTCNSQILSQERTSVESFEEILFQHSFSTPLMNTFLYFTVLCDYLSTVYSRGVTTISDKNCTPVKDYYMYLAFNKPSSTPSAINLTAFEISCLDVYAKQTFKVALEEVNTNKDKKLK